MAGGIHASLLKERAFIGRDNKLCCSGLRKLYKGKIARNFVEEKQ